MALATVSFTTTYDYANGVFVFTDTSDYVSQGVSLGDALGGFRVIDPNGTVIWNNTNYGVESGVAGSAISIGGTSIELAVGASAVDNFYNGLYISTIIGFTSQTRRITAYNGTTKVATVDAVWIAAGVPSYDFTYSDIWAFAALTNQTTINLSLGVGGAPLAGNYTIVYTVKDISNNIYASVTNSFAFSFVPPIPSLGFTIDCIAPQLVASDTTNYVVNNIVPTITRTHTLYYPPSLGIPEITSTGTDIATSNFYTPATFQHTLSVDLDYDLGNGVHVTVTLTSQQFINVTCDAQLCDVYCCVATLYNNWKANLGVNRILAEKYLSQLVQVASFMTLIKQAIECGKSDAVAGYVSDILRIANCEAGCGCTSDAPVPVTGLGSGQNDTVTLIAGNGISISFVISGNTTEYTVSIDPTVITTINSLHNQIVTGSVSNTVTYNGGTFTYNIQGADVVAVADTQLPTNTSIAITPIGSPATSFEVGYIGKNYKLLHYYAPTTPATTSGVSEQVVGTNYSMAALIVPQAGDTIRVKAFFQMAGTTAASNCRVRIGGLGGTEIALAPVFYNVSSGNTSSWLNKAALIQFDVTRVTATTARITYDATFPISFTLGHVHQAYSDVLSVPSFDVGAHVWTCTIDDAVAGETQLRMFSLELIPVV